MADEQLGSNPGTKFDGEKIRLDLIPVKPLQLIGKVLTHGAAKYADRNWEKGIDFNRMYGAVLRHLTAWFDGENTDPDSGLPHLAHALCCLMFLSEYMERYDKFKDFDNRPYKQDDAN